MTVSQRVKAPQPEEIETVNEPGLQFHCDSCSTDLTHSVRIRCADPACEEGEGVDICPPCFCKGMEFGKHKRGHPYRVVEAHSYPIFAEDWGADEELLLLEGITMQGLGNWQAISEHVGTRTKKDVEEHYNSTYIDSPNWPLPRMDQTFDIEPSEFHRRKRQRIEKLRADSERTVAKIAPTSQPGVHEVATFLPGRLEFEHELDNDAEELIKDLEFGLVYQYGGDALPEDEKDLDVRARLKWVHPTSPPPRQPSADRVTNGHVPPGNPPSSNHTNNLKRNRDGSPKMEVPESPTKEPQDDPDGEEPTQPPPTETERSLKFKLTIVDMYSKRRAKRQEGKRLIFERGLLEHKKMQAADKKRSKEEKDIVQRLRPFARLQTASDYEAFVEGIYHEHVLRKRIQELQDYRRLGLKTAADIDKYEQDLIKRVQTKSNPSLYASNLRAREEARRSVDRESTPKPGGVGPTASGRAQPAPLNLANAPSLHLLTAAEQTLCSQLRILPKPYLVIKETFVREFARRGGKLRRREARDLVKIDVNKVGRVWDFLVQLGYLKIPDAALNHAAMNGGLAVVQDGPVSLTSVHDSPSKVAGAPAIGTSAPAGTTGRSAPPALTATGSVGSLPTTVPPPAASSAAPTPPTVSTPTPSQPMPTS